MEKGLKDLIRVMVERADKEKDVLMPGYTHLQVSIHCDIVAPRGAQGVAARTANPVVPPPSVPRVLISGRS